MRTVSFMALQLGDFTVKLAERVIETFATLAFAINLTAGGDDAVFVNKLGIPLLGSEDHVKEPALRRLFVEAYTLTSADLGRKVDWKDHDAPLKLPTAEWESRRKRLQDRLPGLKLVDQLDPSHRLIDAAHEMADKKLSCLLIGPSAPRQRRNSGVQQRRICGKTDSAGYLKEFEERSHGPASVTDALRLMQALQRRAVATDMGDLVPFETGDLCAGAYRSAAK